LFPDTEPVLSQGFDTLMRQQKKSPGDPFTWITD
jgi:hypothetical protein